MHHQYTCKSIIYQSTIIVLPDFSIFPQKTKISEVDACIFVYLEYGIGSDTSMKADVYSFIVDIVLEIMTRTRPKDDMFGSGVTLHKWVKSH